MDLDKGKGYEEYSGLATQRTEEIQAKMNQATVRMRSNRTMVLALVGIVSLLLGLVFVLAFIFVSNHNRDSDGASSTSFRNGVTYSPGSSTDSNGPDYTDDAVNNALRNYTPPTREQAVENRKEQQRGDYIRKSQQLYDEGYSNSDREQYLQDNGYKYP